MIFKKNDDNIWQSISDMMTGLMMIFLFVCMGFLFQMKETASRYEKIKNQIHQDLINEFKPEDIARLGAEIDKEELRIIFVSPSVFFAAGDSAVNPHFQEVLAEFFPLNTLQTPEKIQWLVEKLRARSILSLSICAINIEKLYSDAEQKRLWGVIVLREGISEIVAIKSRGQGLINSANNFTRQQTN